MVELSGSEQVKRKMGEITRYNFDEVSVRKREKMVKNSGGIRWEEKRAYDKKQI